MKIYIVASVSGKYMVPVSKLYKRRKSAENFMNRKQNKNDKTLRILVADNWHEEVE